MDLISCISLFHPLVRFRQEWIRERPREDGFHFSIVLWAAVTIKYVKNYRMGGIIGGRITHASIFRTGRGQRRTQIKVGKNMVLLKTYQNIIGTSLVFACNSSTEVWVVQHWGFTISDISTSSHLVLLWAIIFFLKCTTIVFGWP